MRIIRIIRTSLLKKVILVIMAVVLLPLSIWTILYFDALSKNHYNNKIKNIQNAMSQTVINMDNVMETYIKFSWVLADDFMINDLVKYSQIDQKIIVQTMYHIKPLLGIIMYQNDYIESIRIIHNNKTLFNIYNLLYREEKLEDRIRQIHELTPDMRFPKTAIEYCQQGHLYPFTDSYQADTDIWYIYTIIDSTSLDKYVGFIEVVVNHEQLCQSIADLPTETGESIQLISRTGSVLYATGDPIDQELDLAVLMQEGVRATANNRTQMTTITYNLQTIDASLVYFIPQRNLTLAQGQLAYLFFAVVIMISSLLILSFLLSRLVLKKLLAFSNEIEKIDNAHSDHTIPIQAPDEIGILIVKFNQMIERLNTSFERERDLLYAQLTNQLKPHFICNAMDMLRIKAEKNGQSNIATAAQQISKYFRYSMIPARKTVSLRDELNDTVNYIQLVNHLREMPIEYSLTMDSWIEKNLTDVQIPKLILQPIVENAVRHGLTKRTVGFIAIDLKRIDNALDIQIEDNGVGMDLKQLDEIRHKIDEPSVEDIGSAHGLGLINVKKRLAFQFSDKASLQIDSQIDAGTRVIIRFYID